MRIILLGLPGSGKEELARRLSRDYDVPILTLETTLTEMAAQKTELGRIVKEAAFAGKFSDELIMAALRVRLDREDARKGFILEDFPRTTGQAETLDILLKGLNRPLNAVLKIDIEADDLMEHLVGQITCQNCGEKYNIYNNPPIVEGMCNVCGERIRRRPDDYEENIANRLRNCEIVMAPLTQYYTGKEALHLVDGNHPNKKIEKLALKLLKDLPESDIPDGDGESTMPMDESLLKMLTPPRSQSTDENRPRRRGRPRRKPLPEAEIEQKIEQASATEEKPVKESKPKAEKPAAKTTKKKVVKKAPVKKAQEKPSEAAKKTAASKKKVSKKKVVTKKTVTKKTAAKKAVAKKKVAKKAPVNKAVAKKKVVTKKAAVKKKVAKKTVTKKVTAKKKVVAQKKTAVKKKPKVSKSPAKKVTAKKSSSKKVSNKPSGNKKTAKKKKAKK